MPQRPATYRPAGRAKPDARRPDATQRGYTRRWKEKIRKPFLDANPLCVECSKGGRITEATVVDHIVPHRGDPVKFNDISNLQSLCQTCHNRKTARGL